MFHGGGGGRDPAKEKNQEVLREYILRIIQVSHLLTQHSAIMSDMPNDVPKELQEINH